MTPSRSPNPVAVFFGWLLMCAGALVAATTGACTVFFLAAPVLQGGGVEYFGGLLSWIVLVMIVGGIPCLVGIGLFLLGREIKRVRKPERHPFSAPDEPQDLP